MDQLLIKNGNLYIDHALYDTHLSPADSVVLLLKECTYYILPVQQTAGGLLMKVRNIRGDRVIHAQEFLQGNGIDDNCEIAINVQWDAQAAALIFRLDE